jgi:meiotic recombination protein SPO11
MPVYKIKSRNSTDLPTETKIIDIDTKMNGKDLKKLLKEEFELPNLKFRVFLKKDKTIEIHESDLLSEIEFKEDKKFGELDIKKEIDLSKFKKYYEDVIVSTAELRLPYGVLSVDELTAVETRQRLIDNVQKFLEQSLYFPETASFSIPSRGGDNIGFDETTELVLLGRQRIERMFRSLSSVKSVEQLTRLMSVLDDILSRDIHVTKRDLFYTDVNAFETQGTSDNLIDDLSALLSVTRPSLNVSAASKGIVIGHIQFEESGDFIDCTAQGMGKSISPNISKIKKMESDAELVLIIEKDAVFNRLAEDHFYDYVPSIIITAKGQPDMATRMFLKKIDKELKLPIVAIMDADVYGFEILRVYSVGSKALSFEATNLAVPNIKWMGLLPSDLEDQEYKIPSSTHLKLTNNDKTKIKSMLQEEFVKRKPEWVSELQTLQRLGVKAEIQALNARDPQFITNHYLPNKLENANFI